MLLLWWIIVKHQNRHLYWGCKPRLRCYCNMFICVLGCTCPGWQNWNVCDSVHWIRKERSDWPTSRTSIQCQAECHQSYSNEINWLFSTTNHTPNHNKNSYLLLNNPLQRCSKTYKNTLLLIIMSVWCDFSTKNVIPQNTSFKKILKWYPLLLVGKSKIIINPHFINYSILTAGHKMLPT